MSRHVVIVGAGISGLTCAWSLRDSGARVTLLEASDRLGGNIRTYREQGFVMDAGPDAWIATKPEATALAKELGLDKELIGTRPEYRRVYVAHDSRLHPMPEGVVLGVPTRVWPMVTTRLFSLGGKARMGLEPFVRARDFSGDEDESVGDFVDRRLGREATERLAGPLLGGIFAGDVRRISVRAAFPQLLGLEQKHGSLVRAMRKNRRPAKKNGEGPQSMFISLRGGMSGLPDALAAAIDGKVEVRRNARIVSVEPKDGRYAIRLEGGETLDADALVLAAPPHATARLVERLDAEASRLLGEIRCGSSAAVFLGYRREDVAHPLDATGFVVPRDGSMSIVACTFVSSKWESRAPEGHVLLRAFLGGAGRESTLEVDDEALVRTAREELVTLLGKMGEPELVRVYRHVKASPQPEVGHLARMREVKERLAKFPGVYLAGNAYEGTGIPDCIKQGRAVAAATLAQNSAGSV
ncbi:MAG TPA: protoporphyrinogen oxidase [Polyangiaceae bacterium]|nr:protoporphyrinogen oxidase [Polyangiaceae bacterium]